MRIMKKAMAMIMSMVMMLATCVTAFAAEGTGSAGTFTITAPKTAHQYEIYQIFTGKLDDNGVLTDIKWGTNGTGTTGESVEEATLNEIMGTADKSDTEKLSVITKYANLTGTPVGTVTNGSTYQATAGYYLIKDKDNTVTGTDAYTTYLVKISSDFTIEPKSDVPSFEKKIKDTNDSTGETSAWQDSADYDIGDQVPFKLEGTVAPNYDAYKTYYFAFHDQEETVEVTDAEGNKTKKPVLKFNSESVKVSVDGTELSKDQYTLVTDPTDACTFEVIFTDLKTLKDSEGNTLVKANSKITVEYTSELTEDAVLGNYGNVNKAKLEFSNNPNNEQAGKPEKPGETPWDNVIVFTYKVVVDKYANSEDGEKLAGAEFKLEKVLKDGTKKVITTLKSDDGTSFTFKGLDDGDYILTETTVPSGYNSIDPIKFTVKADHTIEWNGQNRTGVLTDLTGTATTGNITFTANADKSELATKVVNKKGITLPSTGGIGTTIFYVIGGILVAGAAIVLVTRKRMETEK